MPNDLGFARCSLPTDVQDTWMSFAVELPHGLPV